MAKQFSSYINHNIFIKSDDLSPNLVHASLISADVGQNLRKPLRTYPRSVLPLNAAD